MMMLMMTIRGVMGMRSMRGHLSNLVDPVGDGANGTDQQNGDAQED